MVLPVDFYQLSRSMLVKVKRLQGVTLRKFKALFGVSPIICSKLWFDILKMDECFQPHHLLWGLFFLKCYATEDVCSIIAQSDNKTFRKWTWRIVHCLSKLNYIDFSKRMAGQNYLGCKLSVDCTDCPINEPFPFDTKWYSHKFKSSGFRYEVALSIASGNINWVSGPFPAGVPDINIFRKDLVNNLIIPERVIADKGYRGEGACLTSSTIRENERFIKLVRSRHETINKRLKHFFILKHRFRHNKTKHGLCFHAISQIVQLTLSEEPLFSVK